ncbi:MAG: autotransporter domain-containing protein [Pseudomonadota bacterium]
MEYRAIKMHVPGAIINAKKKVHLSARLSLQSKRIIRLFILTTVTLLLPKFVFCQTGPVTPTPAPRITATTVTFQANSSANLISPSITGSADSVDLTTQPAHGIATVNGFDISYTPSANYVGTDSLSYTATGPGGTSSAATASITVIAIPPTTANLTFQANSGANPIPTISSTASSFALNAAPNHGVITINGLALTYTPNLNYVGNDTFSYDALGPNGVFASSIVNIVITAAAPTINISSLSLVSGQTSNIDLAASISGPIFTGLTIAIATAPSHGTATISGTILTYIPARNFVGIDTLSITATGVGGTSSPATITVTVLGRPDPSQDTGVVAMQAAAAATVRHFERTQLDNFNGRLTELASKAPSKASANKQCGEVAMWAAGLNGLGSYKGPNGFDYNNSGTSIGGDRCFGSGSTVAGFGIGYGREHSKLNADGSVMRATAATGAAYGSLQLIPSIHFSWVAGLNQIDSNFDRYIAINKSFGHGKWSGKQYLSSGSISHDFKFDQFYFVPFFKLDLSRLRLDPYAETGGGAFGLRYQAQTMSSQRTTVGFNGEYTMDTSFGELTPRIRVEYQRDSARRNPLQVSYADGADDLTYIIPADELDRHALLGSMGAELVLKNGVIVILNYAYSGANGGNKASGLQLRLSYKF